MTTLVKGTKYPKLFNKILKWKKSKNDGYFITSLSTRSGEETLEWYWYSDRYKMTRYFIEADWDEKEKEVTKKQYIAAEESAGFYPRVDGETATDSFSGNSISGRTENGD